jgi:predicted phosphodiesterase
MRLAVLSDIHGNLIALEAVLADLQAAGGADKIWMLGDLCYLGPRPAECVARVRALPNLETVRGNTDRYITTATRSDMPPPQNEDEWRKQPARLRERERVMAWTCEQLAFADFEFLSKMRGGVELEAPGYGWAIGYHGTPGDDEGVMTPDTPDDVVLDNFMDSEGRLGFGGHTHLPMDRDLGLWRVVNVGSIGLPFDGDPRACYALVTFEGGNAVVDLRRVEYDIESVVADLQAQGDPYMEATARRLREGKR